ncbi:MAG TPA: hypothetical protein VFS20_26850 [Longimicrobium sp.]|nr:hypothetical protein [Longimicrobium sp.]
MSTQASAALAATRSIRASQGYAALSHTERQALEADLRRIEGALAPSALAAAAAHDPYAMPLETPDDLRRMQAGLAPAQPQQPAPAQAQQPARQQRAGTEAIGERARAALEAVDFPTFVAELINGTFQAIVDATAQQVREYARLVASLAKTADEFGRENVSPNQVRFGLADRHPQDLVVVVPQPGERGEPVLRPRKKDDAGSPDWLAEYGLGGQELTAELAEGALLDAGRRGLAEERMQNLATMVLLGINRIVIQDGQIKARLQFHASARENVKAGVVDATVGAQGGIAARDQTTASGVMTRVSTVSVNAQADVAIKANLVGEVAIRFRSETFNLERFADSQAIELINRHSRLQRPAAAAPQPAAATAPAGGTS